MLEIKIHNIHKGDGNAITIMHRISLSIDKAEHGLKKVKIKTMLQ
jgi:hypothetical protein